jgi:hypothetical protein
VCLGFMYPVTSTVEMNLVAPLQAFVATFCTWRKRLPREATPTWVEGNTSVTCMAKEIRLRVSNEQEIRLGVSNYQEIRLRVSNEQEIRLGVSNYQEIRLRVSNEQEIRLGGKQLPRDQTKGKQ